MRRSNNCRGNCSKKNMRRRGRSTKGTGIGNTVVGAFGRVVADSHRNIVVVAVVGGIDIGDTGIGVGVHRLGHKNHRVGTSCTSLQD